MKQYKKLLKSVLKNGTIKSPARAGMPATKSLFGGRMRFELKDGFPMLQLRPISWKGVVVELLWFLKGDTNIKYLDENGVDFMWHQDAYNYYCKINKKYPLLNFKAFCEEIKGNNLPFFCPKLELGYNIGDCGHQYGKLWRDFNGVDQIKELISGLKQNPESRRHILTALDPVHYDDMALFTCHNLVQFNCRKLTESQRRIFYNMNYCDNELIGFSEEEISRYCNDRNVPQYYLDCQFYQRSADLILGVPYNTASYALLTEILAKICNMIPGDLIHTFGDVHIYDNHLDAAKELMEREPKELPILNLDARFNKYDDLGCDKFFELLTPELFKLFNYTPHPKLKAETKLSTGLI